MNYTFAQYQEARTTSAARSAALPPRAGYDPGSGHLGGCLHGRYCGKPHCRALSEYPHFKVSTAPATRVSWCSAPWRGQKVAVMQGLHHYEATL